MTASAPAIETPSRRFEASRRRPAAAPVRSGPGRYVVQLGAYGTASAVERAWAQMLKRFGFQDLTPLSTTVQVAGRGTLHRL
jgi:cell division septation protein DedD